MLDLDKKNLVLVHLQGFEEFKDEDEVPYGVTARGIAAEVGLTKSEPFNTLDEIEEEGLIEENTRYILGENRERNVYFLTEEGKEEEKRFWNDIKDEKFTLKTGDGEKNLSIKNIKNQMTGRNPVLKALQNIGEDEIIDITALGEEGKVFIGREKEQQKLKEGLKNTKKEGTKTYFVEGEAGIGKTSLVFKLKPFAKELGFEFLVGTCQSETSDPYLPFKEAFSDYIENRVDIKDEAGVTFIRSDDEDSPDDKRLFDAKKSKTFYDTTNSVRRIAERNPLVVFLDDLQWVDRATLEILVYMNKNLKDVPVFFIGTYRSEDVSEDHHLVEMMRRLNKEKIFEKIELDPLTYEDTERTVKGVLGTEDVPKKFIDDIHEKTEGNPLFIKECIQQMLEERIVKPEEGKFPRKSDEISVSDLVYNVIERRINRLDDETVKIIEVGSVIGGEIPFDLLSKTVEIDSMDLLDHVDMLIDNQLWEEKPGEESFTFCHQLIQETVYTNLSNLKKILLHKNVGKNIEELYEGELDLWYSDLGRHHRRAEKFSDAMEYYLKSGEKAKSNYSQKDAIEMYEKALEMAEEAGEEEKELEIKEKLIDTYRLLGDYHKCREIIDSVLEMDIDKGSRMRMYGKKSSTYWIKRELTETLETVEEGMKLIETDEERSDHSEEVFKLLSHKAWSTLQKGDIEDAHEIFEELKEISQETGDDDLIARSHHNLGSFYYHIGKMDAATEHFEKSIDVFREADEKKKLINSLNNLGLVKMYKSDYDEAEEYFKEGLEKCKKWKDIVGESTALNNLGDVYRDRGEFEKALDHFEKSKSIEEKISNENGVARCLNNMGIALRMMGELDKALEYHEESLKTYRGSNIKFRISWVLESMGEVLKLKKDYDKALERFQEAYEIFQEVGENGQATVSLAYISEIFLEKDMPDKALQNVKEAVERTEEVELNLVKAVCKRSKGKIHRKRGELKKAKKELTEARDLSKDLDPTEHPKFLYELGLLHLEMGEHDPGKEVLEDALDSFEELGMSLWAKRTRNALYDLKNTESP